MTQRPRRIKKTYSCPKCGSIKVVLAKTTGACLNPQCNHKGIRSSFRGLHGTNPDKLSESNKDYFKGGTVRRPIFYDE